MLACSILAFEISKLFFNFVSNECCVVALQTGKLLKENNQEVGHKKTITSLTKSADGSHFLSGSLDQSAKAMHLILAALLLFVFSCCRLWTLY